MAILAMLYTVLHIALSSLWDGMVDANPYFNLFELTNHDQRVSLGERGRNSGYDGIIPMFKILNKENEDFTYGDADAVTENVFISILPEHSDHVKHEMKEIPMVIVTDSDKPGSSKNKANSSKTNQNKPAPTTSKRTVLTPPLPEEEKESKPEPMPTFTRIEFKDDDRGKKALDVLLGPPSSKSINVTNDPPASSRNLQQPSTTSQPQHAQSVRHSISKPTTKPDKKQSGKNNKKHA